MPSYIVYYLFEDVYVHNLTLKHILMTDYKQQKFTGFLPVIFFEKTIFTVYRFLKKRR